MKKMNRKKSDARVAAMQAVFRRFHTDPGITISTFRPCTSEGTSPPSAKRTTLCFA